MSAPERIWVNLNAVDTYFEGFATFKTPAGHVGQAELLPYYILAAPSALAASPEVQALIRGAVEAERERCAPLVAAYEELLATVKGECPSLINEDSGGSNVLIGLLIEADYIIGDIK